MIPNRRLDYAGKWVCRAVDTRPGPRQEMKATSILFTIPVEAFRAAIFDLDGVVAKTARVHAAAWKRLFDEFRRREAFQPFDIDLDFRRYVDGKPRYDAVQSLLESRGIELRFGSPADGPEEETVCGLGNRKDRFFQEELAAGGVERYESTVELIRELRQRGLKTAIVSSSGNCVAVLERAGALDLFDARVDGNDAARAARELGVEPRCAIVVEHTTAGVQAACEGGFGMVIGVDRAGRPDALREAGAHFVVTDLAQVGIRYGPPVERDAGELPSALDRLDEIRSLAASKRLVVFLDYDGTLTPIVARPEDAVLTERARAAIENLAALCTVAVISGRGLAGVRKLVGIDGLFYAGSHGFEIAGPGGLRVDNEEGAAFLPLLDQVQGEVEKELASVEGSQVERKKFSVAVHYRNVPPEFQAHVKEAVDRALARHGTLRVSPGKKVWDIQPDIDWNKGKALLWLLGALGFDSCATLPLYIGDDTTDEDAFRAIYSRGVGIVVKEEPRRTAAQYALRNTDETRVFLERLAAGMREARR